MSISRSEFWAQQRLLLESCGDSRRSDHQVLRNISRVLLGVRELEDLHGQCVTPLLQDPEVPEAIRNRVKDLTAPLLAGLRVNAELARAAGIVVNLVFTDGFPTASRFVQSPPAFQLTAEENAQVERIRKEVARSSDSSGYRTKRNIDKSKDECRACGRKGHWSNDPECPEYRNRRSDYHRRSRSRDRSDRSNKDSSVA